MTEHKYTDDEIVKALEICDIASCCDECAYRDYSRCNEMLAHDALSLIQRQRAEVAYWQDEAVNAKREAVKEFADRLKKYYASLNGKTAAWCVEYHIDQIAKEMLEGGAINSKDNH